MCRNFVPWVDGTLFLTSRNFVPSFRGTLFPFELGTLFLQ